MLNSEDKNKNTQSFTDKTPPKKEAFLGKTIDIKAELSGDEDLVIEGKFQGKIDIKDNDLTVEHNAEVDAEIHARPSQRKYPCCRKSVYRERWPDGRRHRSGPYFHHGRRPVQGQHEDDLIHSVNFGRRDSLSVRSGNGTRIVFVLSTQSPFRIIACDRDERI